MYDLFAILGWVFVVLFIFIMLLFQEDIEPHVHKKRTKAFRND